MRPAGNCDEGANSVFCSPFSIEILLFSYPEIVFECPSSIPVNSGLAKFLVPSGKRWTVAGCSLSQPANGKSKRGIVQFPTPLDVRQFYRWSSYLILKAATMATTPPINKRMANAQGSAAAALHRCTIRRVPRMILSNPRRPIPKPPPWNA